MAEPRDTGADIAKAVREALAQAGDALGRAGEVASSAIEGALAGRGGGGSGWLRENLTSELIDHFEPLDVLGGGEEDSVRIELTNPGETATEPFGLSASDLKSDGGDTIPASAVVLPDHQRVIAGNSHDAVPVTVRVPAGAKPGTYKGELSGGPQPAPISVEVR